MWSGGRYCESAAGSRFRYAGYREGHHEGSSGSSWRELRVDLVDPVTGLRAEVFYRILIGQGALRSWVRLSNHGREPVTVESVTSFLCGGLSSGRSGEPAAQHPEALADLDVRWAENDWLAEGRWQSRPLRDALPDLNRRVHGADPRGRFGLTSQGTWSSGAYLPMGAVIAGRTGHAWAWQIEHHGGLALAGRRMHPPPRGRRGRAGWLACVPGYCHRRVYRPPRPRGRRTPLADHASSQARRSPRCRRPSW